MGGGYAKHVATDEAKAIYKPRAATVHSDAKAHRGLGATALGGIDKVTKSACRFALTHDIRGLDDAVRRSRANRAQALSIA